MSPPKLSADAPVADVLVPRLKRLRVPRGEELELAFPILLPSVASSLRRFVALLLRRHRAQRRPRQPLVRHLAIPLVAQIRLDRHVASITVADAVAVGDRKSVV